MGGTSDRLQLRARRRAEWLEAATTRLEADANVAGAWLFGSLATGKGDALSDVDLFVAITEEVADDVLPTVESTFVEYGRVLSQDEVVDIAPPSARAFVVTFPAPVERLSVDWIWQRSGDALLGSDVRVLVDKIGLVAAEPTMETAAMLGTGPSGPPAGGPRRGARRADRLQQRLTRFWASVPSVARMLARGDFERAEADLATLASLVDEATSFLSRQPQERVADNNGPLRPLANLRSAVVELAGMSEALRNAGLEVPSTDAAFGWLELAEDLEAEGWRP